MELVLQNKQTKNKQTIAEVNNMTLKNILIKWKNKKMPNKEVKQELFDKYVLPYQVDEHGAIVYSVNIFEWQDAVEEAGLTDAEYSELLELAELNR